MPSLNKTSQAQGSKPGVSSVVKIIAVALAIFFLYTQTFTQATPKMEPTDDSNDLIPIRVTLSDISSDKSEATEKPSVNLKVTLQNTADKPISFLRWSSPFDARAAAMGIFVFKSKTSGEPAPCLNMKLNRKPPASGVFSSEDTIQIEAGGQVEKEVRIKAPEVTLKKGEKYTVSTKGWWMHVKLSNEAELKTDQSDVLRGDFESEAVDFEVPS